MYESIFFVVSHSGFDDNIKKVKKKKNPQVVYIRTPKQTIAIPHPAMGNIVFVSCGKVCKKCVNVISVYNKESMHRMTSCHFNLGKTCVRIRSLKRMFIGDGESI